jgi:hypothetical protein
MPTISKVYRKTAKSSQKNCKTLNFNVNYNEVYINEDSDARTHIKGYER